MPQEKKTLVIVESPTKAETIKRYLDRNYTIVASKGHVRDLPEDHMAIDIEGGFVPQYIITEGKENLIRDIRKKLKDADELLLATDEDREGESISWHLVQLLKPQVPYRRMVFHEITRSAITEALKGGRDLDMNLVKAQEDRRIIDRLFGYEVSPVLWRKLSNKKLSGGRVQSVGLRFIVEKELERLNYKSSVYNDIKADFGSFTAMLESVGGKKVASRSDFDPVTGEFTKKTRLLSADDCQEIIQWCRQNPDYVVTSATSRPTSSNPMPPFTTSTLQQAASSRLRLSSKETMRIAQSLFENGFITYMRTDSVNLSKECISAARSQIEKEFGPEYLSDKPRTFRNKSKNAQEAHEAIRPAGDSFRRPEETGLKGKELALYALIWVRTIATQMASARKMATSVKIQNGDYTFAASGTTVLFPGYLKAYSEDAKDDEKEQSLPAIKEGEHFTEATLTAAEHTTSAPSRYSEASLIRKLEEQGIGRPSTYATIISTLLDRGYVRESERTMIPTFTGFAVNACMTSAFSQLVDYSYTSDMEDDLDRISNGEEDSLVYLRAFYYGRGEHKGLKEMVEEARASRDDYKTLSFPHFCGKAVLSDGSACSYSIKIGPYGAYIATDLVKENGKALIVNIPPYELPGMMGDDDIASMISAAHLGKKEVDDGSTVLKKGQWGEYWQRGDKICNVPRGRKKATDYTEAEIDFLFSLPKTIATDSEGNEVVAASGRFGFYLKYRDKNYKLFAMPIDLTAERAFEIIGRSGGESGALRSFADYEGRSLAIRRGKFGPFLKWGDANIRLPKKDVEDFTEEEIHALCQQSLGKIQDGGEVGEYEGYPITVAKGRYGNYLKWKGSNYSLPRNHEGAITKELAISLISQSEEAKNPPSLGDLEGEPVMLVNGRYGYYLKWKGTNYRIPQKDASALTLDGAVSLIKAHEAEKPSTLGDFEGESVTVQHGRYGFYLKYGSQNIALPAKYKSDASSLTLEEAIEVIRKKQA